MQKPTRKVAPDGGYAWVACFGVSLVNVSAFFPIFGIFFEWKKTKGSLVEMITVSHEMEKRTKRTVEIQQVLTFRSVISQFLFKFDSPLWNERGWFFAQLPANWTELNQFTRSKHAQIPKISNGAKKHILLATHAISEKKVNDSRSSITWWK